ncbi:hypothetical protein M422DRAFT_39448 [Sphaerobolus stellatus SS14]|uniref:C2H2-type domain-containing protein n=1 Tax=Sphaerobolus stellatus (strain SS14) TaxID=990650 RepID=A0A0C9UE96_SPHS4|nr:hypothetical protein M422DRAFT_39448 [Sphaerobolus stellatus SS14]
MYPQQPMLLSEYVNDYGDKVAFIDFGDQTASYSASQSTFEFSTFPTLPQTGMYQEMSLEYPYPAAIDPSIIALQGGQQENVKGFDGFATKTQVVGGELEYEWQGSDVSLSPTTPQNNNFSADYYDAPMSPEYDYEKLVAMIKSTAETKKEIIVKAEPPRVPGAVEATEVDDEPAIHVYAAIFHDDEKMLAKIKKSIFRIRVGHKYKWACHWGGPRACKQAPFGNKVNAETHIRVDHLGRFKNYRCISSRCGQKFRDECSAKRHVKSFLKKKPVTCPKCKHSYARRDYIKVHKANHCPLAIDIPTA